MSAVRFPGIAAALLTATSLAASAPPQRNAAAGKNAAAAPVHGFSVVKSYPHDRQAFTQGLEFVDGVLYESTGLNGRSGIRKVNLSTGEVLQVQPLDSSYFGEGITVWKNRIIQLTWQHGLGFVYDRQTFQQQRTFKYTGEGWGLTHDGARLIMSDGSDSGTLPSRTRAVPWRGSTSWNTSKGRSSPTSGRASASR
jgi:glutaminyl-peptide cyclotransferase